MLLNLGEIIEVPGGSVGFDCELDPSLLLHPSIKTFNSPPVAAGQIRNIAGALMLTGEISSDMRLICDRCLTEYDCLKKLDVSVPLAAELQDAEDEEIFLLSGDFVDLAEVLGTCFILDMQAKSLCVEDCAGLCLSCGANLNSGPCNCRKNVDPRLAVLEQLLENSNPE